MRTFERWLRRQIFEIIKEESDNLYTLYTIIDRENKKIGSAELHFKPSVGDRIRMNAETHSAVWPLFVVEEVELDQTGFTGTLTGRLETN